MTIINIFFIEIASEMMDNVSILVIIEIGEDEEPERSYTHVPHAQQLKLVEQEDKPKKNKAFQYFFLKAVFIKD